MKNIPTHFIVPDPPEIPTPKFEQPKLWEDGESPYDLMKRNVQNSTEQLKAMQ